MQAAEETGRKLKVYAVEKNPNAVITLHVSSYIFSFQVIPLDRGVILSV